MDFYNVITLILDALYANFSTIQIYWFLWFCKKDLSTAANHWNSIFVNVTFSGVIDVSWDKLTLIYDCSHYVSTDNPSRNGS
ncbi:hypothetical protein D3C86_2123750 [compost metagenome]